MNNCQKKAIKTQLIKLGKTNKKQRSAFWQYILENDLGVGYYYAQEISKKGINVLKSNYREGQPD